jgi:hypothetical protein
MKMANSNSALLNYLHSYRKRKSGGYRNLRRVIIKNRKKMKYAYLSNGATPQPDEM